MKKLRVAQIGTEHDHASEAFATVRKMSEYFDMAGFAFVEEDGTELYELRKHQFDGAPVLRLDEILEDPSIEAVLVETNDATLTKYARHAL